MKLAAIYNVWDSEYFLEKSISQIESVVDEIIIVYQNISNHGEENNNLLTEINRLKLIGIKFHEIFYTPSSGINAGSNEIAKRKLGFNKAKELGCNYFIHMDCDELYNTEQFLKAWQFIKENNIITSACKIQCYYKEKKFKELENYYVPFICKINSFSKLCNKFPVYSDPTRGVFPFGTFHEFQSTELVMHHYSYCRKDIRQKLDNSSAKPNYLTMIDQWVEMYNRGDNFTGRELIDSTDEHGIMGLFC